MPSTSHSRPPAPLRTAATADGDGAKTATVTPSDGAATYISDLTKGPGAGGYAVSATATGNYSGASVATLTIGKATPTLAWATPSAIAYGTALSASQLDATASVRSQVKQAIEAARQQIRAELPEPPLPHRRGRRCKCAERGIDCKHRPSG